MPEEVRSLKITGDAAHHYHKSKGLATTRKRGKKGQNGGFDSPPGVSVTTAQNYKNAGARTNINPMRGGTNQTMPGSQPPDPTKLGTPAVNASLAAKTMPMPTVASPPSGGTAHMPKMSAMPPPTPASMMKDPSPTLSPMAPAKGGGSGSGSGAAAAAAAKGKLTLAPPKKKTKSALHLAPPAHRNKNSRKGAHQTRKIRVQLSGLKKRMTKAKTIHKDSREKPIAEVRRLLEEAKLVKPQAQGKPPVPESVLRDIYKDYLLLRNRAL